LVHFHDALTAADISEQLMNDFKQQLAPGWSAVNIGLTVVLFLIGWPLGLLMLAYIIWGQRLRLDLGRPETLAAFWKRIATAFRAGLDSFSKHP
jgi:hypothetical protein